MSGGYSSELNVIALLSLLKQRGIRKAVVSPGTCNMAFVVGMQRDSFFQLYSCVDERSAAYMACGMSAESGEPVILSCTGATASRNYMPGLTEAYYRKLPVLAVTSSQPSEHIGNLFPQCTDRRSGPQDILVKSVQIRAIGRKEELPHCELELARALNALRKHGGGPVHINLITASNKNFSLQQLPAVRNIMYFSPSDTFPMLPDGRIGIFLGSHPDFSEEETMAIDQFCAGWDAIVFCDHTGGYHGRYGVHAALIGAQENREPGIGDVDLLIHIGEVSGDYYTRSMLAPRQVWRVSEDGEERDLLGKLTAVFDMTPFSFFVRYVGKGRNEKRFYERFRNRYEELLSAMPELPFSNAWIAGQVSKSLPETSVIYLGILNSLRNWNWFEFPLSVRSYSNVGGFGIDGGMSSLVGASLVSPAIVHFAVVGDLAFFYDLNILGNRHIGNNIRVLLINNGGGIEFKNYSHPAFQQFGSDVDPFIAAEGHFGHQSRNLVRHFAEDLGFEYLHAADKEEFLSACKRFLVPSVTEKPIIFEVFTDVEAESESLRMIRTIRKPDGYDAAKSVLKKVIGQDNFTKLVRTFKK